MKKVISFLVFAALSTICYSQVPLVDYEPVIIERSSNNTTRQNYNGYSLERQSYSSPAQPSGNRFQTIAAYYYDSRTQNWKRTKIKVNVVNSSLGGIDIYVRGFLDRSTYMDNWRDCNNRAFRVSNITDQEFIVNNFEWKVDRTDLGTIYFNY